jgi:predicted aconitase with swiveling domain
MATASNLASRGVLGAFDSIAASTTGSSLVAAVPGCKIRVLTFLVNHGDTTASTVTFNSASTANGVIGASNDRSGLFETARGEALTVTTGAGSTTGVMVTYELIGNS